MRALAWSLSGVGLGLMAVLLIFYLTGDLHPVRNLAFGACICWALATGLFLITDHRGGRLHRRKRRPKPL